MGNKQGWASRLRRAIRKGEAIDLLAGDNSDPIASQPAPRRSIPGTAIRKALLHPQLRPDPRGLAIRGAIITGQLDLRHAVVSCQLQLQDCVFEQDVLLNDSRLISLSLRGGHLPTLRLDRARISGALTLGDQFTAKEVTAMHCDVDGHVDLSGARLGRDGKDPALRLHNARISGDLMLGTDPENSAKSFNARGLVSAGCIRIEGNLVMRRARLESDDVALHLDGAKISGSALMDKGFEAIGTISAIAAHIGGEINLTGAVIHRPGGIALNFGGTHTAANIFFERLRVTGEVRLAGATIGRMLALGGGGSSQEGTDTPRDAPTGASALVAEPTESVVICERNQDTVYIGASNGGPERNTRHSSGPEASSDSALLRLDFARIGILCGNHNLPRILSAMGWKIGEFQGALDTPTATIRWLESIPSEHFSVQSWHEVASVFERQGRISDANLVRFRAAHKVTNRTPRRSKWIRFMYAVFAGYGYYPLFSALWLAGAALVGGFLTEAFGQPVANAAGHPPAEYNGWLYGAMVVIPSAAMFKPSSWDLAGPVPLTVALIALSAFGWLWTGILLASLTSLLKKG
ncbi:MAG: hypothetical protein QM619_11090 [Micropruina sp.]|uniref:hypothetical protein n=1 Tax=Micropruina sp. TaxID=2737536 RepID=UPI0039E699D2